MSTCYIAGPMTGIPGFNYRAFDEARDILRTHGWKVISPADLDRVNLKMDFSVMTGNEDLSPWRQKFARQDMEALLKVERLFVLEGWEQSTGARNEMTMAAMLGVPICTFPGHDPIEWEAHFSNAPQAQQQIIGGIPFASDDVLWAGYTASVDLRELEPDPELERLLDEEEVIAREKRSMDGHAYHYEVGDFDVRTVSAHIPMSNQLHAELTGEVRVTDPETGGEKGTKLARYDLIPAGPLLQLAEHYGIGARKYADRNWERGYAWSLSFAALQRHAWAFWMGEDTDGETLSHHMAAVAFHAFALMHFGDTDTGTDDRP
jgi:hypothetical protein